MQKSLYTPVKDLGQNFLNDSESIHKMINALELSDSDVVIEVGPGLGVLTEQIAKKLTSPESHLYAVDIDDRFVNKLQQQFAQNENIEVLKADILKWLPTFNNFQTKPFKLLGSLPYYITSPIVHAIIHMEHQPEICVLLLQKEVAERIFNKAPDATYLSVFVQTFYNVEYLGKVDARKFTPSPKVDSGILKLTKKQSPISSEQIRAYSGFLHKGFSNPRKMLNKVFSKEEIEKYGIDPTLRPQNLEVEKWVAVFKSIQQ